MREQHGQRDSLRRRILMANWTANATAVAIVVCVLIAFQGDDADLWLIAAVFFTAVAVTSVRLVTKWRIELFQLGPPGPKLIATAEPDGDDDEWN